MPTQIRSDSDVYVLNEDDVAGTGNDGTTAPLATRLAQINPGVGYKAEVAATDDTGSFSLISFFKRLLQKITAFTDSDRVKVSLLSTDSVDVGTVTTLPASLGKADVGTIDLPSILIGETITIAVAGTRQAFSGATVVTAVTVQAPPGNADNIEIWTALTLGKQMLTLQPGEFSPPIFIDTPSKLFVNVLSSGDKASVFGS